MLEFSQAWINVASDSPSLMPYSTKDDFGAVAFDESRVSTERGALAVAPAAVAFTPALEPSEINERALIIDTETTGRSVTSEIIEIAVGTIAGEILYDGLVRPTSRVPSAAARIHGLTTESLSAAPTWDQVWAAVEPIVRGHLLIAYNAAFDRRMIELMAARYRLAPPPARWRCAMRYVKSKAGWRKSLSLTDACRSCGLPPGTHRAATDVIATAALLRLFR
jgi:DNA polymerase-3 subunit epsilon